MLASLFRSLGGCAVILGVVWVGAAFTMPAATDANIYGMGAAMAKFAAAAPGAGLLMSGLLLMAAGEALWHLERIARFTKTSADNSTKMAAALSAPAPAKDAATTFKDAIQLFQAKTGKSHTTDAIRDLAEEALRQRGMLR